MKERILLDLDNLHLGPLLTYMYCLDEAAGIGSYVCVKNVCIILYLHAY